MLCFLFQIKRFLERIDNKKIRFSLYGLSYLDDEYFLSVSLSLHMLGKNVIFFHKYNTTVLTIINITRMSKVLLFLGSKRKIVISTSLVKIKRFYIVKGFWILTDFKKFNTFTIFLLRIKIYVLMLVIIIIN